MKDKAVQPDRVLVVEDKGVVAVDLRDCLEGLGYRVTATVASGEEAIEQAERERPDAVLMDIHLTGEMDGIEAADHIIQRCHIPVVFLTAYTDDDLIERAEKVGSYGYVVKPYQERELHASLRMALSKGRIERKLQAVQEDLRKARTGLEAQVAARTTELLAANKKLLELDRLKSMFIASMSHELRTPLNSIIGFTGVILQGMTGEIPEETRTQLTMVQKSGQHLLALVNDVIDVGKIEADKVELERTRFDLVALTLEVVELFRKSAKEKGLELTLEAPESLSLTGDEHKTRQVILNLAGNAVKFTDSGSVELRLDVKEGAASVIVSDSGAGIRKEEMEHLFSPFSRIRQEGEKIREGSGLGLYLSRKIAGILGGGISVKSTYGKGSTFTFTLPTA